MEPPHPPPALALRLLNNPGGILLRLLGDPPGLFQLLLDGPLGLSLLPEQNLTTKANMSAIRRSWARQNAPPPLPQPPGVSHLIPSGEFFPPAFPPSHRQGIPSSGQAGSGRYPPPSSPQGWRICGGGLFSLSLRLGKGGECVLAPCMREKLQLDAR